MILRIRPIIKKLFLIGVLLSMCSCNDSKNKDLDYTEIANKITFQFAKKMQKSKNLMFAGWGGAMMRDIQTMNVSFNYYVPLQVPAARKLVVECVQEYLKDINANEEVRPYLRNYPFTEKNVTLAIFLYEKNGDDSFHPNLRYVTSSIGNIRYCSHNGKEFIDLLKEPYEEALKILKEEETKNIKTP
jgi:hypothetical protein